MKVRLAAALVLMLALFASPADAAGPNLLRNASWEQPSFEGWDFFLDGPSDAGTQFTPGVAREGAGYGVIQTAVAGRSFAQDVHVAAQVNHSYSFSVWMRSASGAPYKGTLALFGMGSTIEGAGTDFTVGGTWTLVTTSLNVSQSGHTDLRAQVYMHSPSLQLQLDGAQLIDAGLTNSSWERGFNGWSTLNGTAATSTLNAPSVARDGGNVGVVRAGAASQSIAQDQPIAAQPGQSHTFSLWLRSASGAAVSGRVVLWALGGTQESAGTAFTVGGAWQLVSATLSVGSGGHSALRSEVYIDTPGVDLFLDGAQLVDDKLANAGFDQGYFRGWDAFPRGALAAATSGGGSARDGSGVGAISTDAAGRSFAQNVPMAIGAGESYTFSAWVRSPSGKPVSGSLVVRGLGGQEEQSATPFTIGSHWTLISAPLNTAAAHTSLRTEVVLDTPGQELDVDAASLAAGNARDDTIVPPDPEIPPPPPPAPPVPTPLKFVRSAVSYKWSNNRGNLTRMVRLIVRDVPEGGTVELRCKGKGCPTRKTVVRKRIATTSFKTLFGKRRLRTGATVEVRVLAPNMIGKVARFTMRRKKLPKVAFSCMAPGARAPAKCPK